MNRQSRRALVSELLDDLQRRAIKKNFAFNRASLPGRKRDLMRILRSKIPQAENLSEHTLEEDLYSCRARFPSGSVSDDALRALYPECFEVEKSRDKNQSGQTP
jgi:hypothetical protein